MREDSVRSIQTRLFMLLLRAFIAVVLLTLAIVFALTTYFLATPSRNPPERISIVTRLETFYLARGGWRGVKVLLPVKKHPDDFFWENAILVDPEGRVLIDRGKADSPLIGESYTAPAESRVVPLFANDERIGTLIFDYTLVPRQVNSTLGFLAPIGIVSLPLVLLTMLIGILLLRRMVNPLAQVIAAARAVAAGDLSTRVPVSGPDDLRALSDSFNHMAETLERNNQERRDMLADIAHELRTPLTIMRGRLEGIVDGIYPASAEQITPALEETYLLERLVDDLRLLTLAESRQLHFEKMDVNLNDLARRVIDMFQAEAEEKKISLTAQLPETETIISADPQRTGQVIGNLVSNAIRYTPEGGKVWIALEKNTGGVTLSVNDNGPGVPPEDLPRIFNRFWREEKSRSRASGGAGLGLAIARQLVEAQGGQISAQNLPQGGLQVSCWFAKVQG